MLRRIFLDVHPTAQCRTTQELNATCCNSLYLSWCVSCLKNRPGNPESVFLCAVCACSGLVWSLQSHFAILPFYCIQSQKKNKIVIAHPKGGKMQRFGPLITDSIVCFWFPCFLKGWRKIAVPNSLPLPPPWGLQNLFLVVDRVLWVCGFIIRPCKNPW